eukprot:c24239_g1_i1 orf=565-3333(-)
MAKNCCSTSKISVWWDIENCHVPRNVDPHYIAQNLRSVLHHTNLNGPITIDAFADTKNLEHKTLEALSSTGVTINHIPSGNKDAADKAILVAMLFWALDNPPPAHFLLISGDGDFANALHRLRLKGYDILLARPDQPVKSALLGAATNIWYWTNVAKGHIPVAEEVKRIYEESSGMMSRGSSVSADEGKQNVNQWPAPLQESGRPGKVISTKVPESYHAKIETNNCSFDERRTSRCEGDTSPKLPAHLWVSDHHTNANISHESIRRFDGGSAQVELKLQADANSKTKSVSHTPISSTAFDERGTRSVSSNKIADYTKGPLATSLPMPTVAGHLPGLSQDSQRAYNSYINQVMNAFDRLKLDGLLPTQGNLQDCLCYWDKQHGKFNLKQVLDQAVNLQRITKVSAGDLAFTYFLPCNTELWACNTELWNYFNVGDMLFAFSNKLWDDFHQFLCCSKNWQFFVHCQSLYEAAQHLKNNGHSGIRELAVGEIMQFLNQAVWNRNWLNRNWLSLEIAPTFLLSIKSQVVIKQSPSDGMMSWSSKVTCNRDSSAASPVYDRSTKRYIFRKLRTWLLEISQTRPDYDVSLVPKDFEHATGIHLDFQKLGFAKLQGLIEHFDDVVTIKIAREGLKILCPTVKEDRFKTSPFQDTDVKQPIVTTKSKVASWDKEKQGGAQPSGALTSQRTGASPICFPKTGASDGVSQNFCPEFAASDGHSSTCVTATSKDVTQQAHLPPSVTSDSQHAEASQNASQKAVGRKHPTLKKLRSWLLQLPGLKDGYDLSLVKKDFHEATGIVLDPQSLGYPKVKDILKEFSEDFHIKSPRQGLYLLFRNRKKSKSAMKSNADSNNSQNSGNQSSASMEGSSKQEQKTASMEGSSKQEQKTAVNKTDSVQWKDLNTTVSISDGGSSMTVEVGKKAVVACAALD